MPKDKNVIFGISKVSHFTFSTTTPGLVTKLESVDCLVSHDFQLLNWWVLGRPKHQVILLHMLAKC